jgi:hypothetical protein
VAHGSNAEGRAPARGGAGRRAARRPGVLERGRIAPGLLLFELTLFDHTLLKNFE